uniref:Uncharacterized protein n=1 Tax=Arion vulgaris TaxID=1028688 RepID=A0A0B7B091_9EUPU
MLPQLIQTTDHVILSNLKSPGENGDLNLQTGPKLLSMYTQMLYEQLQEFGNSMKQLCKDVT